MPTPYWQQAARQMGMYQGSPAFTLLQGPRAATMGRRRPLAADPFFTPEEEASALRKAGSMAVGGISAAGAVLDYDAQAIRNLLVGRAPSINPVSWEGRAMGRDVLEHYGVLGPNRPGFLAPGGQWYDPRDWDWGDIAGFGTEVALDPKTYFTFGGAAVGRAGKALKAAGLWDFLPGAAAKAGIKGKMAARQQMTIRKVLKGMPENLQAPALEKVGIQAAQMKRPLAELMDEPLGGAARFWPTGNVVGKAGGWGGRVAAALDPVGEAIRYGKYSPVRPAFAALSKTTRGLRDAKSQKIAAGRGVEYGMRKEMAQQKYYRRMGELGEQFGDSPEAIRTAELHRHYGEGLMPEGLPPGHERAQAAMDEVGEEMVARYESEMAKGLDYKALDDVAYLMRQKVTFEGAHYPGIGSKISARGPFMIAREQLLKKSPMGTQFPIDLSKDIAISGTAVRNEAGPGISKATRGSLIDDYMKAHAGKTEAEATAIIRAQYPLTSRKGIDIDAAVAHIKREYADYIPEGYTEQNFQDLAKMVSEWDPRYAERGIGIFAHHPLVDSLNREMFGLAAEESADIIYDTLGRFAQHFDDFEPGVARVSLTQALKDAHLTGVGTKEAGTGAMAEMIRRLPDDLVKQTPDGSLSGKLVDELRKGADVTGAPISAESVLNNIYVPANTGRDVLGLSRTFTGKETISALEATMREFWDPMVDFFKAHVTAYWPAFQNRNFFSGQAQNQIGGAYDYFNPWAKDGMITSLRRIRTGMSGKAIPGILDVPMIKAAGFKDEMEATRYFFASFPGLGGKLQAEYASLAGPASVIAGKEMISEMPGVVPFSWRQAFGKAIPGSRGGKRPGWWRPTDLENFFLLQSGKDVGWGVETLNRFAPALAMAERGIALSAIIKRVKLLQVDYKNVAAADQMVKRMVPFFAFLKGQTTYLAQELTQKPGGVLAQTIRAEATMQREGLPPAIPEHVRKTAAIPLGMTPEGGAEILTALGFMHEDPLQFLGGVVDRGPMKALTSMAGTLGGEVTGRLAPQISVPIELATGVSLWQRGPRGGRALVDQYGHLGGLAGKALGRPVKLHPAAEEIPQLLGASRWLSTAGKLADERKTWPQTAWNLLTGAHLTTVSPEQQQKVIGESIEQTMVDLGARQYERPYFPKWELEKMPPAERQKRLDVQNLWRALDKRRREQRKQRQAQQMDIRL